MTIVASIHPEEVFAVLTSKEQHTMPIVLLYNTNGIVSHHVSKTVLCLARFGTDSDSFHVK